VGARKILVVILLWSAVIPAFCQVASSKYQPATIMAVKPHQDAASTDSSTSRYDVSLKVGNTLYVVLFTPPPGAYGFQYAAGDDLLVLVGSKTITFNDIMGNSRKVPILSRKAVPPKGPQSPGGQ
jgi:hypothetical protein